MLEYYCYLQASETPADRWEWLEKWSKEMENDDTIDYVRRLRSGPDSDLAFMAAMIGSIIQVQSIFKIRLTFYAKIMFISPEVVKSIQLTFVSRYT